MPPKFRETYPNVKVVEGNFDNAELISATAALNDIVIRRSWRNLTAAKDNKAEKIQDDAKSKHEPSIRAYIFGLLHSATPRDKLH